MLDFLNEPLVRAELMVWAISLVTACVMIAIFRLCVRGIERATFSPVEEKIRALVEAFHFTLNALRKRIY